MTWAVSFSRVCFSVVLGFVLRILSVCVFILKYFPDVIFFFFFLALMVAVTLSPLMEEDIQNRKRLRDCINSQCFHACGYAVTKLEVLRKPD